MLLCQARSGTGMETCGWGSLEPFKRNRGTRPRKSVKSLVSDVGRGFPKDGLYWHITNPVAEIGLRRLMALHTGNVTILWGLKPLQKTDARKTKCCHPAPLYGRWHPRGFRWAAEIRVRSRQYPYLEIKCQPVILVAEAKSESNRKQREIMLRRSFMSVTCTDSHKDKIQRSQSRLRGASCG